jgi:hypothetical protein
MSSEFKMQINTYYRLQNSCSLSLSFPTIPPMTTVIGGIYLISGEKIEGK